MRWELSKSVRSRLRLRLGLLLGAAAPLVALAGTPAQAEILVTNDNTHVWGAPVIAVNPKNPDNIVMAIMGIAFTKQCTEEAKTDKGSPCADMKVTPMGTGPNAVDTRPIGMIKNFPGFTMGSAWATHDRGKTWTNVAEIREGGNLSVFPPDRDRNIGPALSDAVGITAALDGTIYLAWDATRFADVPLYTDVGGIPYSTSTDGGKSWSVPKLTGSSLDGGRLVTDPITGTIYTSSSGPPGPSAYSLADLKVQISKDNPPSGMDRHIKWTTDGKNWSQSLVIGGGGTAMAVAHGLLATAFTTTAATEGYLESGRSPSNNDLCGRNPKPCVIFQTSKEGSGAWTRNVVKLPKDTYSGAPMVAADPTKAGSFAMAFSRGSEIHVFRTQDAGVTWSKPSIVSEASGKLPTGTSMAYGPTGVLAIAWKSRSAPPSQPAAAAGRQGGRAGGGGANRSPYNVVAVISKDGGTTFSQRLKINGPESPPPPNDRSFALSRDGGATVAITGEDAFFAWSDWKTGEGKVMFNTVKLSEFQ